MLDELTAKTLLKHLMTLYIFPELRRRQLPQDFNLRAAQIVFYDDNRPYQIRINKEIKAIAKVKLKPGISKKKGEPIRESEVEGLEEINLTESDDPNCAHVTLVRLGDTWTIVFDFRYNKELAQKHIEIAKEFYETAECAYKRRRWYSLVDNLFSAAELAAKARLLLMPGTGFTKKARHKSIQFRYNKFADLGNVPEKFRKTLNKLSGLRDKARYLKGDLKIDEKYIKEFLEIVKEMIAHSERVATIGTSKKPEK